MNRDTIIRLAEEAGLEPRLWNHTDAFERFAALVAAHEREECAKILDGAPRLVPSLQFPGGHCFVCGLNSEKIAEAIRSRT
jgi:hypothetical protein